MDCGSHHLIEGTPSHIEGSSFSQDFPLTLFSSKPDCRCSAQISVSLLTLKSGLGKALINFFTVSSFRKLYTDILLLFDFSEEYFA